MGTTTVRRPQAVPAVAAGLRRGVAVTWAVAGLTLLAALVAAWDTGVPLRDPRHVTVNRFGTALAIAVVLALLDAAVRAARASERRLPRPAEVARALRERWTRGRVLALGSALVAFHVTYIAYRNLKSVAPLVRPDAHFDSALAATDRSLFLGHRPGILLHDLLGTGAAAHVLSAVYMFFFAFIPITLVGTLVLARDPRTGLFYAIALGTNWLLGAASYFLLPSLGPVYADPATFAGLPHTGVSALVERLHAERGAFLAHPQAPGAAQSIGAFASLHMSIYLTAVLGAQLCGLRRAGKVVLWALTAATFVATLYFGWHYVADAAGGLVIAAAAVAVAAWAVGRRRSGEA